MLILSSILIGLYVGIDHGIWIGLLLQKFPSRYARLIPAISFSITLLQTVLSFLIIYVQSNPVILFVSGAILVYTALQLFSEIPQKRSDSFRLLVRIVFLIMGGGIDNLLAISAANEGNSYGIVLSSFLSFPLIIITIKYLVPILVGRIWFYLYGIGLLSYSAGNLFSRSFGFSTGSKLLICQCAVGISILTIGQFILFRKKNRH